jgi:hypothetical protein
MYVRSINLCGLLRPTDIVNTDLEFIQTDIVNTDLEFIQTDIVNTDLEFIHNVSLYRL